MNINTIKHCRVCNTILTTGNKYQPNLSTKGNGSICYPCHLAAKRARYKSRTKTCRMCNLPLQVNNLYKSNKSANKLGNICYKCYLKEKKLRYSRQTKNKILYIEEKHYPRTRVVQESSEIDQSRWRMSRSFSNTPKKKDGAWKVSEFHEFLRGRKFFTSRFGSRPAREGFSSKEGTRVEMIVYVRQNNEVTKQYQHQVCDECGDDVRIDSRGYKYCTKCFLIQ